MFWQTRWSSSHCWRPRFYLLLGQFWKVLRFSHKPIEYKVSTGTYTRGSTHTRVWVPVTGDQGQAPLLSSCHGPLHLLPAINSAITWIWWGSQGGSGRGKPWVVKGYLENLTTVNLRCVHSLLHTAPTKANYSYLTPVDSIFHVFSGHCNTFNTSFQLNSTRLPTFSSHITGLPS